MHELEEGSDARVVLLRPRDGLILEAYLATGRLAEAARIVGVDRTTAWRASRRREFQAELGRRVEELGNASRMQLLARLDRAWRALDGLLQSEDEHVRLRAALWIAGRGLDELARRNREPAPSALGLHLESHELMLVRSLTATEGEVRGDES